MRKSVERVTIFGDIKGIDARDILTFVKATNHSYGGSYPNCEEGLPDEEVVKKTRGLLVEGGIPDPSPIILCNTPQERATQILENCHLHWMQNGEGQYWIIDRNPDSLVEAVKSVRNSINDHPDILRRITAVGSNPRQPYDHVDQDTGIRLVGLPPYRFPTHPTLDL